MPYDLKKALATVSKSPQPFAIYEGSKGMTVLIGAKDAKEAEPTAGTGCRMLTKGKCAKNADNEVAFKTNLPPQKKWTDGLKKAFAAAGCTSTHFVIEEAGDEAPEEQSEQPSGSSTPPSASWKPGAKPGARPPLPTGPKPTPPKGGGAHEASESETEEVPTGRPRSGGTPPTPPPGWKPGVKPPTTPPPSNPPPPSTPPPTPPPRGGAERESSESESEQPGWKPGVKRGAKPPLPTGPKPTPPPSTPPPTPPRGGGGEASESESEDASTGRTRSNAVSRGETSTPPRPQGATRPGASGGTPPTPPPRTGATPPKPGAQTPSTPPRPGPSPTPPDDAKLELGAQQHLELRKRMKTELTELLGSVRGEATTVNECVNTATAKTAELQSMRGGGAERLQAVALVTRAREQAKGILEAVESDWNRRRSSGSDMMKARGDYATLPKSWPEERKTAYVRESGDAFIAYDTIQRQIQTVLTGIQVKVQEIKLIAEEAETYSGQAQDPQVYVDRLAEMNGEAEASAKYFSDKLVKLDGALKKQKVWAEGPALTGPMTKTIRQMYDLEVQAKDNVDSKADRFEVMLKRATKIPAEARSNAQVGGPLKKFETTAAELSKSIAAVKRDQAQSLAYLNQAISKMT